MNECGTFINFIIFKEEGNDDLQNTNDKIININFKLRQNTYENYY